MITRTSGANRSYRTIAVSIENFQALKKRGQYGDTMDAIVSRILKQAAIVQEEAEAGEVMEQIGSEEAKDNGEEEPNGK